MDETLPEVLYDKTVFSSPQDALATFLELERRRKEVEEGKSKLISYEEHRAFVEGVFDGSQHPI